MVQAGADALELNLYRIATDPETTGADIERQAIETVREVKKAVTIPVAVKLSPFYSALAHLARELDRAGADGLVHFNRFYQPDIDAEEMTATRTLHLWIPRSCGFASTGWRSSPAASRRRLRRPAAFTPHSTSSKPRWPAPMSRRWSPRS
jgi:hypothetical protein